MIEELRDADCRADSAAREAGAAPERRSQQPPAAALAELRRRQPVPEEISGGNSAGHLRRGRRLPRRTRPRPAVRLVSSHALGSGRPRLHSGVAPPVPRSDFVKLKITVDNKTIRSGSRGRRARSLRTASAATCISPPVRSRPRRRAVRRLPLRRPESRTKTRFAAARSPASS